jgi:hypothetical protein
MLITSFGDGAGSKLKAVKQLPFEVTVNRVVTQAPAKQRFSSETCRSNLRGISQAKSERVRRDVGSNYLFGNAKTKPGDWDYVNLMARARAYCFQVGLL